MARRRKKVIRIKSRAAIIALAVVVVLVGIFLILEYNFRWIGIFPPPEAPDNDPSTGTATDELSIHFLETGNKYTGDCVLIKTGNVEMLVDAGSRQGSAATLVPYINNYCTDGKLEYVIATHADQDHIAAFVGTTTAPGIFASFECATIIDFPRTDKTSQIYSRYCETRDAEVNSGAKHYTALQCWNNEGGAKRTYTLADDISFSILYNYYYEYDSGDENNYSVCFLLEQGDKNYLFTGDLEKDGEERLVANNTLPECELFKAGHHGSKTSSNECLLSVIKPDIVVVCCCAGSDEYTDADENMFPTQAFCDRVKTYTSRVYVTTIADGDSFKSMNGNVVVKSDGVNITVTCSASDTVLSETDWYRAHRQ